ncbi:unnamed protein product [Phytophthora fragariaefolia]|uniref:RxLR effector protein n=1 Tax=Phytophthora fragariaefolia TaxID=1490495 RepID=A0A9W6XVM2_9STRA|nr:unnamed protein product [Phytophthora fragariaefolia]
MRFGRFLVIAAVALLVDQDCDAASQATKVSTLETGKAPVNAIFNAENTDRHLRSDETAYDSIEHEERLGFGGLVSLLKLKRSVDKGPIDVTKLPITAKLTRKDFSKTYISAMQQNDVFKTKMFKKWDVYEQKQILSKMKKVSDKALVLEYLNRRSRGVAAGNIVTRKANINV